MTDDIYTELAGPTDETFYQVEIATEAMQLLVDNGFTVDFKKTVVGRVGNNGYREFHLTGFGKLIIRARKP